MMKMRNASNIIEMIKDFKGNTRRSTRLQKRDNGIRAPMSPMELLKARSADYDLLRPRGPGPAPNPAKL